MPYNRSAISKNTGVQLIHVKKKIANPKQRKVLVFALLLLALLKIQMAKIGTVSFKFSQPSPICLLFDNRIYCVF